MKRKEEMRRIGEDVALADRQPKIEKLKEHQRTISLKIWHDHADIVSQSHSIYDTYSL